MEKFKKNLPVILLSVACTLLLVIVILLVVDHKTFSFTNSSTRKDTEKENLTEVKDKKKEKEEIKEEVKEEIKDEIIDDIKDDVKVNTNNNSTSNKEEKSESALLAYFDDQSNLFNKENSNNESLTSKLKTSFTNVIDFIFYEKEIKGYKFKELTNSAKLKVISIALAIDTKIDQYFPNYKEKIKDAYTSIKGKLALKYLEVTASFCSKDPETCTIAKEDFSNMKESFGFTWDLIKEMAKSGTSKVKELYENWRDE